MYKGASRSGQRLRDSGRSATNQRKRGGKGKRSKSKAHIKLDAMNQRIKVQQWVSYLAACRKSGTTPEDPPEDLKEALERELKLKGR